MSFNELDQLDMEQQLDFTQIIIQGLKGLPQEQLREVAEFIYFVRQKSLSPDRFKEYFERDLAISELSELGSSEVNHLEKEFEDYQKKYPKA